MSLQDKKKVKTVLITGTNGMLGKDIYNDLFNKGFIVFGVDLIKNPILPDQFQRIGDLTEKNFIISVLEEINPDIIVHCAAIVNLENCQNNKELAYAVHVNVTKCLAQFKPINTKLIYISTDSVFDGVKGNYKETDKPNPINYYAESKLEGEKMTELNPNHIIIRTNIFGFNIPLRGSLCEWAIKNLQSNRAIKGFPDVVFNAIYTKHLAIIISKLIKIDFNGLINVATINTLTKYEFLSLIIKNMGFDQKLISKSLSININFAVSRPLITNLNTKLLQKIMTVPSMEEGIIDMVKEYKKQII
jgi:dTDP-4-dehydrorhamnose reductase